jgi:hypothetical protein
MTVTVRQSATATDDDDTTVTLGSAPVEGNLLALVALNRGDVSNDPSPTVSWGAGTVKVARNTAIADSSHRRAFLGAAKVAGSSESASVTVNLNAQDFNTNSALLVELEGDAGEVFAFFDSASNDNGDTDGGSSVATGNVTSAPANCLAIGLFGARAGSHVDHHTAGTSSWDSDDLGGILNYEQGANARTLSFAFAEVTGAGTRGSTATVDPLTGSGVQRNTGLSSAMLVFSTVAEEPGGDRGGRISFAELETPLGPRAGRLSFAELEVPTASRAGLLAFAELQVPDAPRAGLLSFAELQAPSAPRSGRISWAEFAVLDEETQRRILGAHLRRVDFIPWIR